MSVADLLDRDVDLVLDPKDVESTWSAVCGRITKSPTFQVVGETAIATIESVIMRHHDEAFDRWPKFSFEDKKCRVHFWKARVLDAVPAAQRGLMAVYYHEYIAALERADNEPAAVHNYGGEPRAQYDAYVACTASLD